MNWMLSLSLVLNVGPVHTGVPNRQPQLSARPGMVAMVFGSGHSIWFSRSPDNGLNFSPPIRIAESAALSLGHHGGPRVAFSGKTLIVSAIVGSTASESNLTAWRSQDDGSTWSKPVVVNDHPGAAREGLHAMAADPAGRLAAVWLDLRSKGTRLYGAFSDDAGATWSKNALIYESPGGTICECCDPSITATGPGEFAAMWRNSLEGMRDLYMVRVRDGKTVSKPVKLGVESWKLAACPMDGGGVAVANGRVVTAWRREKNVYTAEPGNRETAIGVGKDVAIAAGAQGIYVAWTGSKGIEIHKPGDGQPVKLSETGAFPALAGLPDGSVLAAWEENGAIATQRIGR